MKELGENDSLIYYQCHVEEAVQQMNTASGQTITGKPQKYTITEKFVLIRKQNVFSMKYFTSSLNNFPNRKFSNLKIREKDYWYFIFEKEFTVTEKIIKLLQALENKGHEAIEYEFVVNKYITNQLIIRYKKNFRQLIIDGNYLISKMVQ